MMGTLTKFWKYFRKKFLKQILKTGVILANLKETGKIELAAYFFGEKLSIFLQNLYGNAWTL